MINTEKLGDTSGVAPELVQFLNKLITKHEKIPQQINVVQETKKKYNGDMQYLAFYDPRFTGETIKPIGTVSWDKGSRGNLEYRVCSRLIDNARFRWSREDNTSQCSKDINKAIKSAMQYILQYDMKEFAQGSYDNARRKHRSWVDEIGRAHV